MIIPCIVDSHCDSIQPAAEGKQPLVNPYNYSQKYPQLQFVAFFCGWPKEDARASYGRAHRYLAALRASVADGSQNLALVKSYADIEAAFAARKHAALFSMEGATGLCGSVAVLREFYGAGLRVTGLAWLSNDLAKSNRVISDGEEDTGLTGTGREIVAEGNRLGIIFDVSHLSDKSFWDLAEIAEKPIIASHSNFRSLCGHSRNLTDEMAKEIIRQDGMIGLNLCKSFISDDKSRQTAEGLFDHLDHCLELGGEDHIGFGCDIDGIESYPEPLTLDRSIHEQLIEIMAARGYSDSLIEKVAYQNWMDFLKKYL